MNKPNKCKNCQWYGKPYWSIINPCDNCPNENNVEIITIGDVKPIKEYLTEKEIKKAMTNKSIFKITLEEKDKEIEKEITEIFNKHGLDSITNTPDYILADYVMTCLYALFKTKGDIEKWFGKEKIININKEAKGE